MMTPNMRSETGTTGLALDGIRVLDLSRILAGPFCGALLGDMGADVIKIEYTRGGDESRSWPPQRDGEAAAYIDNNRNKRGIAVDLKTPEGVEIMRRLVLRADVLVENFRIGTMESFGLGYDALAEYPAAARLLLDLGIRAHGPPGR